MMKKSIILILMSVTCYARIGLHPVSDDLIIGQNKYESYQNGYAENVCQQAINYIANDVGREWKSTEGSFFHTSMLGDDVAVYIGDAIKIKTPIGEYADLEYMCVFNLNRLEATIKKLYYKNDRQKERR